MTADGARERRPVIATQVAFDAATAPPPGPFELSAALPPIGDEFAAAAQAVALRVASPVAFELHAGFRHRAETARPECAAWLRAARRLGGRLVLDPINLDPRDTALVAAGPLDADLFEHAAVIAQRWRVAAEAHGVTVVMDFPALQRVGPARLADWLDELNSPCLAWGLDLATCGADVASWTATLAYRIGLVFSRWDGPQSATWPVAAAALADAGYDGPIVLRNERPDAAGPA